MRGGYLDKLRNKFKNKEKKCLSVVSEPEFVSPEKYPRKKIAKSSMLGAN